VAYQMQVEAYGGLSVAIKRRLREIADAVRNGDANAVLGSGRIKPGTQMIRQWQNTTHKVTALNEGFEWDGRTYKSLSAVANAITGTNWNGYAFFGIKRAPSSNKNAAGPRRSKLHAVTDAEAGPVSPLKTNGQSTCVSPLHPPQKLFAAQFTPGSHPKRDWNRISTPCMPSASPVTHI
jgi:hypothetical protein